ncbi:AraC family transcriptional regulator [Anaerococcus sp. AGMB09787]|uniref:helix-turn-helix domain-containing protein n=1 Tax=Anaerococcus sp. AGMB09787 TaxID=2922869 RepID=UPI001FB01EB9|nr:AraC family transcriptional regulator [Anaerococcus sp. AGMB09787]
MEICECCANNCNEIIDKCLKIIDEQYCNKLSLDELANSVHISKNYLSFLFKKEVGLSFNKYVNLRRIDQAKKMIMDNESLDQVAYACGYSSQAHFSANFKKYTGLCPKDFKKGNAS